MRSVKPFHESEPIVREDTNYDFRKASAAERLSSLIVGDPIADYKGFPEIQKGMLEAEAAEITQLTRIIRRPNSVESRHRSMLAQQDMISGRPESEIRCNLEHLGAETLVYAEVERISA